MGKFKLNKPMIVKIMIIVLFILMIFIVGTVNAEDFSIKGRILDRETNEPIINATIIVFHDENGTLKAMTKTGPTGYYEISGLPSGFYKVNIVAEGYHNQTHEIELKSDTFGGDSYELSASLVPISGDRDSDNFLFILYKMIFIISIVLIISILLYSKLKRENLLKNSVRKRIFDYIKENPGKHYRAILNDLDLPMGVLTYHINSLEKGEYIKSKQDGVYRRFYISGSITEVQFFLSHIQEAILTLIKENKGISQTKIAEKIGVSRNVVNYHIKILDQAGLIFVESHGRESTCYAVDTKIEEVGFR